MEPDLAPLLVKARRAAGLTQAELARRAGISASYLSRIESAAWERGGPWPTDSVLRALARALGLSSTELVALLRTARARQGPSRPPGHLAGINRRLPYTVTVGHGEVDRAARELIGRNPVEGTLRCAHGGYGEALPSYGDALAAAEAAGARTMLSLVQPSDPLVVDVLVGEHEVLLTVPDRRGRPYLRAGVAVDDPDFVAALRDWFDEALWHPARHHGPPVEPDGHRPGTSGDAQRGEINMRHRPGAAMTRR